MAIMPLTYQPFQGIKAMRDRPALTIEEDIEPPEKIHGSISQGRDLLIEKDYVGYLDELWAARIFLGGGADVERLESAVRHLENGAMRELVAALLKRSEELHQQSAVLLEGFEEVYVR